MLQNVVTSQKIKVLIIDDSALIRSILKEVINSYPDMETVGAAANPLQARDMIKTLNPDVLTLDVEMLEMDVLRVFIMSRACNGFAAAPTVSISG